MSSVSDCEYADCAKKFIVRGSSDGHRRGGPVVRWPCWPVPSPQALRPVQPGVVGDVKPTCRALKIDSGRVGFSKSKEALDLGFERYKRIAYEVRKTRMLGSAALAMAYIACGRLDAYVEEQISLWDIAAGQLMVESGGGKVETKPSTTKLGTMFICATNGKLGIESYL